MNTEGARTWGPTARHREDREARYRDTANLHMADENQMRREIKSLTMYGFRTYLTILSSAFELRNLKHLENTCIESVYDPSFHIYYHDLLGQEISYWQSRIR